MVSIFRLKPKYMFCNIMLHLLIQIRGSSASTRAIPCTCTSTISSSSTSPSSLSPTSIRKSLEKDLDIMLKSWIWWLDCYIFMIIIYWKIIYFWFTKQNHFINNVVILSTYWRLFFMIIKYQKQNKLMIDKLFDNTDMSNLLWIIFIHLCNLRMSFAITIEDSSKSFFSKLLIHRRIH